jgi:long-chain acyl-CoA synthetase
MDDIKIRTLDYVFNRSTKTYSEHIAFSWVDGHPITYGQVHEKVTEISGLLIKQGIRPGDKVAILSENCPNWGISYFAITTIGAVVVPILPDFHQNEIHHILKHSGSKGIFISEKLFQKIEDATIEDLNLRILINNFTVIPPESSREKIKSLLQEGSKEFAKLKDSALKLAGLKKGTISEDDTAAIIYTSGTTGNSKGVVISHKNLVFDALATYKIQPLDVNDRLISILPLPHTYECTLGFILPFMCGSSVYYLKKPPTGRVLIPAMQKIRPTMIMTVPLIIEKIFKTKIHPKFTSNLILKFLYKLPLFRIFLHRAAGKKLYRSFGGKLQFFGIGGALLSAEVEQFLRDAKFPYAIGYGLTETSPLIAGCSPKITRFRSTGPVIPGVEVRIEKKEREDKKGEIQVKGDNVMKGYFKNPDATKEAFTDDGWFKTGDLGYLNNNGYLFILGRIKNVIIGPSGENIYPEEIEAVLNENDYVLESLVFQSNDKITARIFLNYELLDEELNRKSISEKKIKEYKAKKLDELRKYVNERVSVFSRIQKIIEQPEPFEKTPTKKIKRYLYIN